jgi:hypothetical protein
MPSTLNFIRAIRVHSWLTIRGVVAVAGSDGGAFWHVYDVYPDMAVCTVTLVVGGIVAERIFCTNLIGNSLEGSASIGKVTGGKDLAAAGLCKVIHLEVGDLVQTFANSKPLKFA